MKAFLVDWMALLRPLQSGRRVRSPAHRWAAEARDSRRRHLWVRSRGVRYGLLTRPPFWPGFTRRLSGPGTETPHGRARPRRTVRWRSDRSHPHHGRRCAVPRILRGCLPGHLFRAALQRTDVSRRGPDGPPAAPQPARVIAFQPGWHSPECSCLTSSIAPQGQRHPLCAHPLSLQGCPPSANLSTKQLQGREWIEEIN